ncbi:MAG TPA: STAS domain-containing protein [Crinalium sp.]|jgi:anti-anti-sigma factor
MLNTLTRPQVSINQPSGHLNAANVETFRQELLDTVSSQNASCVLVDMAAVESLDSAGLMVLVSALTTAQQSSKRFALCNVSSSIRIIFELTQLDRVFEMFDSRSAFESAIA